MSVYETVYQQLKSGPTKAVKVYSNTILAGFRLDEVAAATRVLAVSDGRVMRLRGGFTPNPAAR